MTDEKQIEMYLGICFNEFCEVAGDSPCGCDACPYGEYGSEDDACRDAYIKDKLDTFKKRVK